MLCFMFKIGVFFLKVVKLNPCVQQVAVRWHSKTYRKNVACCAGST